MAKVKIYGKLIGTYGKHANGYHEKAEGGIIDLTLEIYETKTGLKGVLWQSRYKGWKENKHNIISTAWFKERDRDIFRVLEYYGFKFSDKLR